MCWMCDQDKSAIMQDFYGTRALGTLGAVSVQYHKGTDTRYLMEDGFVPDGVGERIEIVGPTASDLVLAAAVLDTIPGDTSTTVTLTVGGARLVSTINTPGDFDFYKIELVAGVTYDFGMYAKTSGPTGVPLADAFIEIYDSEGNKLAIADGGATTQLNNVNSGLDVLYSFTAETTGTYYINARAYDNAHEDGDTGEFVGDYEIFARVSSYRPYYDLDSPLHSLDWGTQFDGTSRNPDGDRGTRPDGLEVEGKIGGKNIIYVYFARQGEVFVDGAANPLNLTTTMVAKGLEAWERQAFENVFAEFEKVADIDYVETEDRYAADIVVITYDGTPGPGVSLLGRMSPPDTASEGQTEYNSGDARWTQEGLAPGGFYFGTLIHEFGHGHGMAHPHDNGGKSSVMRDENTESGYVEETSPFNYTLGTGNLNQSVYTMMSYMDGWQLSPYGQPSSRAGYGFIGSLMALDIAVIQDKYGVNENWATGNDTYTLMDVNQKATFDANGNQTQEATAYKSIWDAGGTDAIVYSGAKNANIDLRPATLKYEEGGGGWISYAFGIHGGYTIANGVTIENATSGSGNDTLIGNDAANVLDGGAGTDQMTGGKGNDTFRVDNAGDKAFELVGEGHDVVLTTVTYALTAGSSIEVLVAANQASSAPIDLTGNELGQAIYGSVGNNVIDGGGGADVMFGYAGDDQYYADNAGDMVIEAAGAGHDVVFATGDFTLTAGSHVEVLLAKLQSSNAAINLTGNELNNVIYGSVGPNVLNGKGGADIMFGFAGNDTYYVDHAGDVPVEAAGEGHDVVYASADYALGAGQEIEVLLAQFQSSSAAINLSGNDHGNAIYGSVGANTINGKGGMDVLYGYAGADRFVFDTSPAGGNYDYIADFEAGVDKIVLDNSVFSALADGALASGAFRTGTAALDADDRIIYDSQSGQLLYDADGNGAGGAVLIAMLSGNLPIAASDFAVI